MEAAPTAATPSNPAPEDGEPSQQAQPAAGWVSWGIAATLLGGTLLLCGLIAHFTYASEDAAALLAAAATILLGAPLVAWAFRDLRRGRYHMNELVALAVLAAFVQGWYLEAGAVAFFMLLSMLIESRTALGAEASIESLIRITPTRAHKVLGEGERQTEQEVEASELRPEDVVRVRPGDNIPADGVVLSGGSTVNQATITGESLPADKNEGDEVFGGTINLTGAMLVRVTHAGEDTTLGRVRSLIQEARQTRIPVMRMIDRYAAWYTPTVLMLVFVVWFFVSQTSPTSAAERAIAMLIVACPAPLILATPTAMVAALSAAARLGVLVKSVVDLEATRNLTAMIFDKTGTLTTGRLEVSRLAPAPGVEGADLLRAAAAAEHNSRHPVARAVVEVARTARVAPGLPQEFEEFSGRGVRATLDGSTILVGRGAWLAEQLEAHAPTGGSEVGKAGETAAAGNAGGGVGEQIRRTLASPEAEGVSTLFVARDGKLLGWVGLADNTRAEASASMDELRGLGLKRLIIVTGDRESVARRVSGQMHTDYRAEVLPHEKLEIVDELKARGHRVGMIGDGVNDAPALAAGDISIAMGAAGSDVAIHSASIALMNNNLNRIPFLVRLSRQTSNVVRQNLFMGGGFILLFLGLSGAGYITPITAAAFQVLSSLVVVFNSARLVRAGEDIEHAEHQALDSQARPGARRPAAAEHDQAAPSAVPA